MTPLTVTIRRTEQSITDLFNGLLPRLHVLVIGPGLGRSPIMQQAARIAISLARQRQVYLVIDADGLFLVQNDPSTIKGYQRCVLTPNVVEFQRMCDSVVRRPSSFYSLKLTGLELAGN